MAFVKDKMKKKEEVRLEDMKEQMELSPEDAAAAAEEMAAEGNQAIDEKIEEPVEGAVDLTAENERLQETVSEQEDRMKRLQADFENFRRRTGKEKEELSAIVTQQLLKDMLPLLDNFERAVLADSEGEAFKTGIEMIYKQFQTVLKEHGLEYIDVSEAKFDPNYHQAVMRVQDPEKEDDSIAAELQKGYMVKGKVIRPSMVQVVAN